MNSNRFISPATTTASAFALVLAASLASLTLAPAAHAAAAAAPFKTFGTPATVYSTGVKLAPGAPVYFSAGVLAATNDGATMKEQALAVMKRLDTNIAAAGLAPAQVVFARAYLAPGADGAIDFAGWNAAWGEVFNNAKNPHKPARTTVAVPLLGGPGRLIEIEYVCAASAPDKIAAGSEALALPVTNPVLKPYGTREGRIYSGVGVMPGAGLYWTAGSTAPVLKSDAPPTSYERRGDTKTQSRNTLARLEENLAGVGLTFADVIFLRAFVGPDANASGKFDSEGWNAAYAEFFNTAKQPHKPARTTVTTPTFGSPDTLIEIEILAAFPKPPAIFDTAATPPAPHPLLRDFGAATAAISSGVALKPGSALYFSACAGPTVEEGDMKTQALSALAALESRLTEAGVSFKDVTFLRAYVVPDASGAFDRAGWSAAYNTYFNNPKQPHKPARTTIPVTALPTPGWKIGIDVIAVAP